MSPEETSEVMQKVADRRTFLKSAGVTGLGLASATLAAGKLGAFDNSPIGRAIGVNPKKVEAGSYSDDDILNFALNLEYLEAEFYTVAVTGKTISQAGIQTGGVGTPGATTGGKKVTFPGGLFTAVAEEIMIDEQTHVKDLRGYLGGSAVAKPAIDLDALGIGFSSWSSFLVLARAFEDVGVTAYAGAAPLITGAYPLAGAFRIGITEGFHASAVRLLISYYNIKTAAVDSQDLLPPPSGKLYFTLDDYALPIQRTTKEVLAIVYGKSGASSGGFYPNGMNGTITS